MNTYAKMKSGEQYSRYDGAYCRDWDIYTEVGTMGKDGHLGMLKKDEMQDYRDRFHSNRAI